MSCQACDFPLADASETCPVCGAEQQQGSPEHGDPLPSPPAFLHPGAGTGDDGVLPEALVLPALLGPDSTRRRDRGRRKEPPKRFNHIADRYGVAAVDHAKPKGYVRATRCLVLLFVVGCPHTRSPASLTSLSPPPPPQPLPPPPPPPPPLPLHRRTTKQLLDDLAPDWEKCVAAAADAGAATQSTQPRRVAKKGARNTQRRNPPRSLGLAHSHASNGANGTDADASYYTKAEDSESTLPAASQGHQLEENKENKAVSTNRPFGSSLLARLEVSKEECDRLKSSLSRLSPRQQPRAHVRARRSPNAGDRAGGGGGSPGISGSGSSAQSPGNIRKAQLEQRLRDLPVFAPELDALAALATIPASITASSGALGTPAKRKAGEEGRATRTATTGGHVEREDVVSTAYSPQAKNNTRRAARNGAVRGAGASIKGVRGARGGAGAAVGSARYQVSRNAAMCWCRGTAVQCKVAAILI